MKTEAQRRASAKHIAKRAALGQCLGCDKTATNKHYCDDCRRKKATFQVAHKLELKLAAIGHYSDYTYTCACCSEADLRFLQIDHLNNGGNEHRRMLGKRSASHQLTRWLRDHGYPAGFQVLCGNCNIARAIYGKCPHEMAKVTGHDIAGMTGKQAAQLVLQASAS